MRNPVACVSCRSAKQKCIHNDAPPCDRCRQSGRAALCEFPAPGTSAIHRRPKRPRPSEASETPGATPPGVSSAPAAAVPRDGRNDARMPSPTRAAPPLSPRAASALLAGLDPFDLVTDEVKTSYLRCSYKWSFHHAPTLLRRLRDRTLAPYLAWALLALAVRFVKDAPDGFGSQTDASNAYAARARQLLQGDLETPSISRVQALLMLTGHDWGAGNGRRAWIYLGMAIRLVEVMDLTQELKTPKNRMPTRDEFIDAEVRRRTAWTCFLMDSLLSGGKGRKRSLNAADMAIQLPCEKDAFVFGEPTCTQRLDGSLHMPSIALPTGDIGIIGYSMRVANIWGKVARWACTDDFKTELPWSPSSQFQQLVHELERWKSDLPQRSRYDLFSLHSHNAVEQGQAYCYMHSIYFMSYMFLHRAYLPVLGPQQNGTAGEETPNSYNTHTDTWKSWQKTSRRELFKEATMVLEMLEEMRTFGVFFLRGLVPWIGFTIYTAVGVMLYSFSFPSGEDDPKIVERARERVIQGCTFLKEMKTQWPMAATWFETIKRMQAYYRSVLGQDPPALPEERKALRRAMIDYGALQPSPVQKPPEGNKGSDTTIVQTVISPPPQEVGLIAARSRYADSNQNKFLDVTMGPIEPMLTPPTATPTSNGFQSNARSWKMPNVAPLELDETFSFEEFDLSNADMEEIMMNATHDFWASFPGEVGVGYGNDYASS